MKKKLISLVVSVVLLLSCFSSAYAYPGDMAFLGLEADEEAGLRESDVLCKLLVSLGMLNYDTSDFVKTDPADYSDFITAVAVVENLDTTLSVAELFEQLQALEVVRKGEMPTQLLMKDVVYSMVRLSGFWKYAETKGGYPAGYMDIALNKSLLRNVGAHSEASVTKGELVQLLYNMLSVPSYVVTGVIGNQLVYGMGEPATLLERRFEVVMHRGVVTASGASGLYGKSDLDADQGEINRVVYQTEDLNLRLHLGKDVVAFVKLNESDEYNTLLCLEESRKNKILTLNDANIASVAQDYVRYNDGEKIRKAKLPSNAAVVYNGVSEGILEMVNFPNLADGCSSIELIDNDSDGAFEVVAVWDFQHFAVQAVTKNAVFLKYGMTFNGSKQLILEPDEDDGYKVEAYKNGKAITSVTEISANDAISVAMSNNTYGEKFMLVHVSDKAVSSKIASLYEEKGKYILTVGEGEFGQEKEYPVSRDFALASGLTGIAANDAEITKPQLGMAAVLLLTYDGYVADVRKASNVENYAYIIEAGLAGSSLRKNGFIKLIDSNGDIQIYSLAEKVKYYDAYAMDGVKLSGADAVARLQARDRTDYRCLCIYSLNSAKEITELYTPYDNTGNLPGQMAYPLTLDYSATGTLAYYFGFFDSYRYFADPSNTLFVIPGTEEAEDEKLYSVVRTSFFGTNVGFPHIELYNCNRFYESKVGVTRQDVSLFPKYSEKIGIITDIRNVYDHTTGEEFLQFSYLQGGVLLTSKVKENTIKSVGGFIENTPITDLKVGDLVQFGLSADGMIETFRFMLRADDANTTPFGKTQGKEGNKNIALYGDFVKVVDIKDSIILANNSPDGEDPSATRMYRLGNPNAKEKLSVEMYSISSEEASTASTADLMIGDKLYMISNYGFVRMAFIIRD